AGARVDPASRDGRAVGANARETQARADRRTFRIEVARLEQRGHPAAVEPYDADILVPREPRYEAVLAQRPVEIEQRTFAERRPAVRRQREDDVVRPDAAGHAAQPVRGPQIRRDRQDAREIGPAHEKIIAAYDRAWCAEGAVLERAELERRALRRGLEPAEDDPAVRAGREMRLAATRDGRHIELAPSRVSP